jgi:hypothetical protein
LEKDEREHAGHGMAINSAHEVNISEESLGLELRSRTWSSAAIYPFNLLLLLLLRLLEVEVDHAVFKDAGPKMRIHLSPFTNLPFPVEKRIEKLGSRRAGVVCTSRK